MAVCDEVGELRFGSGSFTGILEKAVENKTSGDQQAVIVQATTLDHFVYDQGNPPPGFIKIDVESAEPLVIAGGERLLREKRPTLLVEVHGPSACRETIRALLDHSYRLHWLKDNGKPVEITQPTQLRDHFHKRCWTHHILALPR